MTAAARMLALSAAVGLLCMAAVLNAYAGGMDEARKILTEGL